MAVWASWYGRVFNTQAEVAGFFLRSSLRYGLYCSLKVSWKQFDFDKKLKVELRKPWRDV